MSRRRVSFLMAAILLLGGLPSCNGRNNRRVGYVGPTPACDRCTTRGPMPPRFVPSTGPVPAAPVPGGIPVPAQAGVAVPAPTATPFAPGAAVPPGGLPPTQPPVIQQNNYVSPVERPAQPLPSAAPKVYLEQPEPATANPEPRSNPSQTPEPPRARDDRTASPAMPVDIPQFAEVKAKIASGQEPFADGIAWLKSHGYRTVLHVRSPGEDDSAARKQFEQGGLRYLSLELSPQTLSRSIVDRFNSAVGDANNLPLFVYDKNGSLAGALWYLNFRLVDRATEEKAREEAERLGFRQERSDAHLKMWLAVQNLLNNFKP